MGVSGPPRVPRMPPPCASPGAAHAVLVGLARAAQGPSASRAQLASLTHGAASSVAHRPLEQTEDLRNSWFPSFALERITTFATEVLHSKYVPIVVVQVVCLALVPVLIGVALAPSERDEAPRWGRPSAPHRGDGDPCAEVFPVQLLSFASVFVAGALLNCKSFFAIPVA